MKRLCTLLRRAVLPATLGMLLSVHPAQAHDDASKHKHRHEHHHPKVGPNGGQVLLEVHPHAELLVTKDRRVQITFLSSSGKAAPLAGQSITMICGQRTNPIRMRFSRKGNSLISDKALPKGSTIPSVLQFKMTPKARPRIVRLNLKIGT
ncbi:MAG: hypothetical protein CMO40_08015 [Verrucomicrobiaceae bacterium]|nr:hypothetical protein [Verrucomicrobiaceae bacterium]